ncbi:MAG: ammonium transporter [Proteobacteria bacterium]|nr:ammonium transporter [Pseudomonadota bacterium]
MTDPTAADALFWVNNTWMLVATFLVFVMHLGFAVLESGLVHSKNTVNVLFKNITILSIGLLTYAAVGFNLMYPGEAFAGGFFGFSGFGIAADETGLGIAYADGAYTYWTDFIFQAMFAATAATIVSGAVAERVKLESFLIFSSIYVAVIYPMVGMWHWGGGWLAAAGFHDFAGSTIVHGVGGWGALVGAWMLGPRAAKLRGEAQPHSLPLAAIGVLLLWFGWYGFNGGSVLSADPGAVSLVVVTTSLAAAAGVMTAAGTSWVVDHKPDLSMALNGALAGLVGVTAGADVVTPMTAIIIGGIAGILVLGSSKLLDRIQLDDPVGAIPVHLVCGIWGTLAVGIFVPDKSIATQLIGVAATAAFCLPASLLIFGALRATIGLRVTAEEEEMGLDHHEHGMEAYGLPSVTSEVLLELAAK